jgi:hypothetical protein
MLDGQGEEGGETRGTVVREYVHQELNQEVNAIGGRYVLLKEVRLPFHGREVLYVVGGASVDTSCCGVGGCAYALVAGFVVDWKYRRDEGDRAVSRVEPIDDEVIQRRVRWLIGQAEPVQQVDFR